MHATKTSFVPAWPRMPIRSLSRALSLGLVSPAHALAAIGYNDRMKIRNASPRGQETTGALLKSEWIDTGSFRI